MGIINRLSDNELSMIEKYIDEYAFNNGEGGRKSPAKYLLREWDRAKSEYLAPLFGDSLILSKRVEYYETAEQISGKIADFFTDLEFASTDNFYKAYYNSFLDLDLYSKENASNMFANYSIRNWLFDLIAPSSVGAGTYQGPSFSIDVPGSDKQFKIQSGCKPMKTLGKIAELYNLKGYEDFRIKISQILNQKKLVGELHLSIHPLDYMTSSDNDCDWISCMSWTEDGAYRQGTVEMMNSPMVVVAYLTAKEPMTLFNGYRNEGETWYNKKWREYIIVTPDIVTNVKGYPYINSYLSKEAVKWLADLMKAHGFANNYIDDVVEYYPSRYFSLDGRDIIVDFCTDYMYNDFSSNRVQYGIVSHDISKSSEIKYSGCSECMSCGELNIDISNEAYLVGTCCADYEVCDECGRTIINDEEDYYWVDGRRLCQDCLDEYCSYDPIEEEYHITDDMTLIYIGNVDAETGEINYDSWSSVYLGDYSLEADYLKEYIKKLYKTNYVCIVDKHDITPLGWSTLFNMKDLEAYEEEVKNGDTWRKIVPYWKDDEPAPEEFVEVEKINDFLTWQGYPNRRKVYCYVA